MIISNRKTGDSCQIVEFKKEDGLIQIIWVADMHRDSKKSQELFLKKVIRKHPKAYIVFGGDSMDIMQNFGDPRQAKSALKESLLRDDYLNAIVEEAVSFFEPFKSKILAFNLGNHEETPMEKNSNITIS